MGSAKKVFTKIAKSTGIVKENKFAQGMVKAGAELEAGRDPTDKAPVAPVASTPEQRAEAARRKSRRSGRRSLMMAGRLGGGDGAGRGEDQTTLGAG
jgi:hypothetical protein